MCFHDTLSRHPTLSLQSKSERERQLLYINKCMESRKLVLVKLFAEQQWRPRHEGLPVNSVKNLPATQETWVGKIPWRRAWQPTPVFLPGESTWTEEPGVAEVDTTEWRNTAVSNTVIHNFKSYTSFIVIIKYWLYYIGYKMYPCSLSILYIVVWTSTPCCLSLLLSPHRLFSISVNLFLFCYTH